MTVFGIQCQFDSDDAERYNRELKPTAVMLINVVKREYLARLKADNPGVRLIYRHHPNYEWRHPTPEDAAKRAVAELKAEIGHLLDLLDYVTDNNEYILSRDHMAEDLIAEGDRYMAAFIVEARRVLGLGTCWGNFNTGHWAEETVAYFPMALAAAEMDGDSPICFHEYNWPEIPDAGHWTCGKVLRAMPPIRERYDVNCMLTEFGVDDGGDPHKGWRLAHEDFGTAAAMFCQGVRWYRDDVAANAPWVQAVLFFGCGMVSPWESFDVAPIIDRIKAVLASPPQPPPEEPPTEEPPMTDEIKVCDMEGVERNLAWAVEKYGVAFERAEVAKGKKVYRLVELREKSGPASLVTKVVNEDGDPVDRMDVAFYWPGAPDPPEPPCEVLPHDWRRDGQEWRADGGSGTRFVHGVTNADGDVGPGMGGGAAHGPGEGGPHAVWVRDPDAPSDICHKLGWLGMTPHDHLDQKFQLTIEGEGPEEPPSEPSGGERFAEVSRAWQEQGSNRVLIIAQGGRDFYDVRASLRVGDVDMGPFHPATITKFELTTDYVPGDNEVSREYVVTLEHPDGTVLGGPYEPFRYETGVTGWWTVLVEWREPDGEPPPEQPPGEPPGDAAAVYRMMAAAHREAAHASEVLAECLDKLADLT